MVGVEDGGRDTGAKESKQSRGPGNSFSPRASRKECSPTNTFISAW